MKESKLILMAKNVLRLEETVDTLIREVMRTQNIQMGILETMKRMPNYQEALDKLKKDNAEAEKEKNT
tara:strand:+ start:163 stop:366 length:204 start_codon:yes stop_codon:yes gene_type:complete